MFHTYTSDSLTTCLHTYHRVADFDAHLVAADNIAMAIYSVSEGKGQLHNILQAVE